MSDYQMVDEERTIAALTAEGIEICGAFQPEGHEYWHLYVTRLVYEATGVQTPPHREHFWGDNGRSCARLWLETLAALYTGQRVTPKPFASGDCSGAAWAGGDE